MTTSINLVDKPVHKKKVFLTLSRRRMLLEYMLLLPAFITVTGIIIYPIGLNILMSFQKVSLGKRPSEFLGLSNYIKMIQDQQFTDALVVTLIFTVFGITGQYLIGLITALVLNQNFHGRTLARMLIVLPWAVPGVVASIVLAWMFDYSYGIVNYFIKATGLVVESIPWLAHATFSPIAVIFALIWKGYPFITLMILAGLQSIPEELYDAAKVDGAGWLHRFKYITMPALSSVNTIAIILNAVWLFREFAIPYVMTGGGPARATQTIGIMIYQTAFEEFNFGYASAIGVFTLLVSIIFSVVIFKRQKGFYQ